MTSTSALCSQVRRLTPVLVLLWTACATSPRLEAPQPRGNPLLDPTSAAMNQPAPPLYKVLFETTQGDVVIEVHTDWAPLGATRFYNLVRNGYYDGARFFRVVSGFVVQFGINAEPAVSAVWRQARIQDDSVRQSNTRGFVTFAMGGPNTRTVQVFINLGNNARLDAMNFAPFGRVSGGMDVVDRFYAEFGEAPPRGRGPDQSRIQSEGEPYLQREFAQLDRVVRARVINF
jgi:peptidyl-prolyl cis-trans isomerase A (cyclophilin A)